VSLCVANSSSAFSLLLCLFVVVYLCHPINALIPGDESGFRPAPWTVLSSATLLSNPWFAVTSQQIRLPDGKQINFQSVEFSAPAVGVIARRDDRILLIRQYRVTIGREVWAIPSGGTDVGETTAEAARRELEEETGYRATTLRPLVAYHPSYGATNQRFELFLAENPDEPVQAFDTNEVIETRWFEKKEVMRMLFANELIDGLSVTPLAMLFLEEALLHTNNPLILKGIYPD
jgi:8-oxo-dGTP pyrophosphatase MutT (NUDIX family)